MAAEPETEQQTTPAEALLALGNARTNAARLKDGLDENLVPIPTGATPRDVLQAFASVDGAVKAADAAAKRLKDWRAGMEDRVLEALEQIGVQRAPLTGGPTIYRSRELWAGNAVDEDDEISTDDAYERTCAALEKAGLGQYVQTRYNVQSLSAYFREREKELEAEIRDRDGLGLDDPVAVDPEDLVPEPLRGVLKISEVVKPKARTS